MISKILKVLMELLNFFELKIMKWFFTSKELVVASGS